MEEYLNDKTLLEFVDKLIKIDKPIYLIGHINTDYDSIGSCCCLANALNSIGKNAMVVIGKDAEILLKNENITYFDSILTHSLPIETNSYCAILMDMNSSYRAGEFEKDYLRASIKVNVDHHNNNNLMADFKFVDSKSGANCENVLKITLILENMFKKQILNKDICSMLCLGIITDTCDIVNSSNIIQTKWAMNEINKYNVDAKELAERVYYSLDKNQELILKNALSNKKEFNKLSYYFVNCNDFANLNLIHNDYAKILSQICNEDKNPIVVFEQKFDGYSVWEFRSNDIINFPVNEIALTLGGGGHKNASGATISNLNGFQVVDEFLKYFKLK